jgi:hypothetical protein
VAALREGERAAVPVTMTAGECATFVAHGGLGLVEVDLFLTTGAPPGVTILAEDARSGPIAVIGGRRRCFENTTGAPIEAELSVVARKGAGLVVVQEYRRPRAP